MPPLLKDRLPLLIAALALVLLPFAMRGIGLGVTSATEVVIFAIACMALNILVGYTGLVSFGHGAWFGLAAYAAGLMQREVLPGHFLIPMLFAVALVTVVALIFGALILRRKGVYFSLLTLALAAMLYTIAFRWTAVTGGEDGLGGIKRPTIGSVSFDTAEPYYGLLPPLPSSSSICSGAFTVRRSAPCSWPSARTSSARNSSAMRPIATSSWPSRFRRPLPGSPARCCSSTTA